MTNKQFDVDQSLELIASMIRDSRTRLARNSGMPFLVWGYTTVIVSLFEFFMVRYAADPQPWMWAWFAIPVMGLVGMKVFCHGDRGARNYIDRVISAVWTVFGISMFAAALMSVVYHTSILYVIVTFIGMGTAITGLVIRDKLTSAAGFLAMLAAQIFPLRTWIYIRFSEHAAPMGDPMKWNSENILIFAAIFFLLMVIPGHILNRKSNRICSKS